MSIVTWMYSISASLNVPYIAPECAFSLSPSLSFSFVLGQVGGYSNNRFDTPYCIYSNDRMWMNKTSFHFSSVSNVRFTHIVFVHYQYHQHRRRCRSVRMSLRVVSGLMTFDDLALFASFFFYSLLFSFQSDSIDSVYECEVWQMQR